MVSGELIPRADSCPSVNTESSNSARTGSHGTSTARTDDTDEERNKKVIEAIKKFNDAMRMGNYS